jgi:hypothetical protein
MDVTTRNGLTAEARFFLASGLADQPTSMPWFGDKQLRLRYS